MDSAQHDIALMVRLQEIYDRVAAGLQERTTPPAEVQQLEEENRRRHQELEELEHQAGELETELAAVRKKELEWQTELEHFQKQKSQVTNQREFTAVISEIDYASRALTEANTRRTELETELAVLQADIESRRSARPEEQQLQHEVLEGWETRRAELTQDVHELARRAQELEAQLQPPNRSRFARLLKSKRGRAMAAVVEGSCSLCHYELRPHVQQRVRRAEEVITCEHCHRILYLPEMVRGEPAGQS